MEGVGGEEGEKKGTKRNERVEMRRRRRENRLSLIRQVEAMTGDVARAL